MNVVKQKILSQVGDCSPAQLSYDNKSSCNSRIVAFLFCSVASYQVATHVHFAILIYVLSCSSDMLRLGKSKPWPEALEKLTDQRTMDAGPIKEYFWPLYLWLREKRCSSKYPIGWAENPGPENDDPCVVPTTPANSQTQHPGNPSPKACARTVKAIDKLIVIGLFFACGVLRMNDLEELLLGKT